MAGAFVSSGACCCLWLKIDQNLTDFNSYCESEPSFLNGKVHTGDLYSFPFHCVGTPTAAHPGNHLQWETSEGLAFLNKVVYKNGSLHCTQPGLYFVYSKLQLGSRECKFADVTSSFFTHGVYRKSPTTGFEEKLLENSRRFCDSQGKDLWKESSYLAGTFRLETGDDIYVKFSQKQLIRESDGTTNFFGLFML
uniref:THD domain-containing protein n=1 Tax=Leptobrachium leishanense TaxID=445787 RepID=A0A8C5MGZ1_9ANUR